MQRRYGERQEKANERARNWGLPSGIKEKSQKAESG